MPRFPLIVSVPALLLACSPAVDAPRVPLTTASAEVAPPPAPLASGRLPGTARPLRYAVSLVVDPTKDRFTGDVVIDLEIPATTSAIVMHGRGLTIVRSELLVEGGHVGASVSARMAAGGKESPEELVLALDRSVAPGKAQLHVAYSAPLDEGLSGLYRVKDGGDWYAFTQFEPTDARRAFPCFDEPGFKVPFELKVTAPKGDLVVANTNEAGRGDSDDGRTTTFSFAPTAPLPTYLVAFAVGPLEIKEGPKAPVPIRVVTTKGKSRLADLAIEAATAHVKILADYFERGYPYPKLDLVAVPEFGYGAMENAGLITFREESLLLDPATASTEARRNMAITVAHELSHQWFGNLVTMSWWDDLWLNEGFATWLESKTVDTWRPAMNARDEQALAKSRVMALDALESARSVRQPVVSTSDAEEAFDGITYDKGAAVLGMLERWLGEDAFKTGIRGYLKDHAFGSATSADLFQSLGQAAGKDVWPTASTFLDQPGVPLVRAKLACAGGKAKVELTQERYRPKVVEASGRHDRTWRIPVCVAYDGAKAGPACTLLDGERAELELPSCPRWIHPNAGDAGYYRFALEPAAFSALAAAAPSLDVRARLGLVTDAWALVKSGDLASDALLDMLVAMRREKNRLVIGQIEATLTAASDALVDDATRPAFRTFVAGQLLPLAKELGWDARKKDGDEERLLRNGVLGALAILTDDAWMVREGTKRADAWLKDHASVDGDIARVALRVAARHGGAALFDALVKAERDAQTPGERIHAIVGLGSFTDPALLGRALDLLLGGEIKHQDAFYLLETAADSPETAPILRAWLEKKLPELKKTIPAFVVSQIPDLVGVVCDAAERDRFLGFLASELKDVEGTDRHLKQQRETSDLCIDVRAREGARARKRLTGKK